jgi:hypothetical protein
MCSQTPTTWRELVNYTAWCVAPYRDVESDVQLHMDES